MTARDDLLLRLDRAYPLGTILYVSHIELVDQVIAEAANEQRRRLAGEARERARAIAGIPGDPPDPRYPVHGETRIQRAEGWYQAADWLATGKEPS